MRLTFAELVVRRFKDGGSSIYGISSIADQSAFLAAEIAEIEEVDVEARGLRGKMRALQERGRFARVEVLADMLTVVALPEQSLDLEV